ncbi:MAG: hypothetical protein JEY94_04360 [Melioribacteraceae bacterium]|nr:hypothetical protein [Melioribacteraceae bacterium]
MFKIIKAELKYYKTLLMVTSIFLISMHFTFLTYGAENLDKSVPALRVSIFAFAVIVFVYRVITLFKEGRDRVIVVLPIHPGSIGFARLLFIPIFWVSAISLFFLCNLIVQFNNIGSEFISELVSLTGLVLVLNALAMIYLDFLHFGLNKKQIIYVQAGGIILAAFSYLIFIALIPLTENFGILIFEIFNLNLSNIYQSYFGAVIMLCIGVLASVISKNIFMKRKTYLNL